jgi:hypothetical protein
MLAPEGEDASCPSCRAACEKEYVNQVELIKACRDRGITDAGADKIESQGVSYRHTWLL